MPCMKLTSASSAAFFPGRTVAGDKVLVLFPGAPGWTIGAGLVCWHTPAAAQSNTVESDRTQKTIATLYQFLDPQHFLSNCAACWAAWAICRSCSPLLQYLLIDMAEVPWRRPGAAPVLKHNLIALRYRGEFPGRKREGY